MESDLSKLMKEVKELTQTVRQHINVVKAHNDNLVELARILKEDPPDTIHITSGSLAVPPEFIPGARHLKEDVFECTCPWNQGKPVSFHEAGHHIDCPTLTHTHIATDNCGPVGHMDGAE